MHQAGEAAYLLTHPVNVAFWKEMESRVVEEFAKCPRRDHEGRLELQNMLGVVRSMKAHYERYVNDGKVAREQLRKTTAEKITERWQRF